MNSNNAFSPPPAPPHITLNSQARGLPGADAQRHLAPPSPGVYQQSGNSQEHLLPPPGIGRGDQSPSRSPFDDSYTSSSRRSSWQSERTGDSRAFGNPFRDGDDDSSRPVSRSGSEDDLNTQTVSEKFNITPSAGLLLFPEDVEKDDYLHNPDPGGEPRDCNIFTRRGFVNVGGLALIVLGLLCLFIGYPVLTFVQGYISKANPCASNSLCLDSDQPLLKNLRTSLVDPNTPESAKTKTDFHGNTWKLAFSDEFTEPGRSFYDGDDPYWHGVDLWYGVTENLEWYDPDAITTDNGALEIRFDAFQSHGLNYRSGMLQSWNQMCFKGGRLEASIQLPARGDTVGLWPGFWTLGNLGRAGFAATTEGMWPYSYEDKCDAGITPNQSSNDGLSWLPGMRLPACTCKGEDHPTPGKSRSAPELDALEATIAPFDDTGMEIGHVSQTFQVAPFDIWYQVDNEFLEVYDYSITRLNEYKGSTYQQSISGLTNLNNDWYEAANGWQVYAFEYNLGEDGDIIWYVGDDTPTWRAHANAFGPNGNVGRRMIPEEPMYVILNVGMSPTFSALNLTYLTEMFPATMRVDYVRIYQDSSMELTCDPEGYETTAYINNHLDVYTNPNITRWAATDYGWPKNTLMDDCDD